ncbi:hypothetical protein MLD38_029557 [Melastoma candidum]|uniref:Uncharacterized protein n=1 Tax=Melastoma candidum TaxID=119954 RepID=A0ACB9N8B5_9MYRT|nr:hypothetical protein MLD38_029557 [Melastoma candidum]
MGASVAASATKIKAAMKLGLSLFRRRFDSSKCKTAAKMTVARIKLLRNKRQAVVKQMRRDIALLLQSGQDGTARIRVEHVMREQNILAANEFIELFCELIVSRLQIISKLRDCPPDLKEGIASLIFAAPRCSEIPELGVIKDVFTKKYGKDFASAAVELRPSCGVNRMLIDKLSVRTPTGEMKLKILKEIAKEHQIDWDAAESESELLKPPPEKMEGPQTFVSAASMPVKPVGIQPGTRNNMSSGVTGTYKDTDSAAKAAAESAKQAVAAAQAAAYLANKNDNRASLTRPFPDSSTNCHGPQYSDSFTGNEGGGYYPDTDPRNVHRRHSYNVPVTHPQTKFDDEGGIDHMEGKINRRHSYNNPGHSDIKFDESDGDEDDGMEDDPDYIHPPQPKKDPASRAHPRLPDYDQLSARFEALKCRKA